MISVIYGVKGSGKTQRIMDACNSTAERATGQVVFITDNNNSLGVSASVKFINVAEYGVRNTYELSGFIKGMLAMNFDIQNVFIDGLSRLLSVAPDGLKPVFDAMEKCKGTDFMATVSADKVPAFLEKYIVARD